VKRLITLGALLPLTLMMLSCEEDVPDYAGDIADVYIVESMTFDGEMLSLTSLALEHALFVKLTREDTQLFMNSDDACDDLDYFVFSAEAGEALAFNDDYDYWDNWNPGLDWTCPTTGDYYFVIEELWEDQSGNYSVSVNVTTGLPKAGSAPTNKQKFESQRSKLRDTFFN